MQSRGQGFSNRVETKKIPTLTSVVDVFYESPTLLLLLEKTLVTAELRNPKKGK